MDPVEAALDSLRHGRFVLIYDADGREAETDLVLASQFVGPTAVRTLRKHAGGLICVTMDPRVRRRLGLPTMAEVLGHAYAAYPVLRGTVPDDVRYDTNSPFSITVNHRETFTGVTDRDRALTISRFAALAEESLRRSNGWAAEAFGRAFRSPGHVPLLVAADGLLATRLGHTELATALVAMAGLAPTATICEMMGDDGRALSRANAKKYAATRNLVFLEGREILEAWRRWSA